MQVTNMLRISIRSVQVVRQSTNALSTTSPVKNLTVTRATGSEADGRTGVEPPDVHRLAQLASIGVTDTEVAEWGPKIEGILDWFGQLQQVDLEGVEPALRADLDGGNSLREDTPREFAAREEMMKQVPEMDGAFVRVPKIAQEGGEG